MLSLRRPKVAAIRTHLEEQSRLDHSFPELGATRAARKGSVPGIPSRYAVDHNRIRLGSGLATFERAQAAIRSWEMFNLPWVQLHGSDAGLQCGTTVGIVVRRLGIWSLNACRIIYTVDEQTAGVARFGFGYGTLPDHLEIGEERFTVEFHHSDDSVWYDLLALSRPGHWLARLAHPYARKVQRAFARGSLRAMARATAVTATKAG
jgi:uncharacterized protein (UPF0548 family)